MTDTVVSTMPMFYLQIEAFQAELHGALRFLSAPTDFRFAAEATVIPLLISELAPAMRHYPLVFLPAVGDNGADGPTLAAVVGLGDGHNLFVDADGKWRADTYIPAYVRRYPFHALRVETQTDPIMAIDSSYTGSEMGAPLIDADGNPSSFLETMLTFTREYLTAADLTEGMARALHQVGVLDDGEITLQASSGASHRINGFLRVDEGKLRSLAPEALVALQQVDALGLAYAQLLSMVNFLHLPLAVVSAAAAKTGRARSRKAP
jgi:hypothetical protein